MRRAFANSLLRHALLDERIWLITADLGYGMWDQFSAMVPERFVNVGAAEQTMLDIAVGLALDGKTPVTYTISPFYYRGFETIRTYIAHEQLHVIMVGSGRNGDYEHDGFSHDAWDMPWILQTLHVKQHYPKTREEIPDMLKSVLADPAPAFVSLKR